MPPDIGSLLHDRYEIKDRLGQGGMGSVYLAFDRSLKIDVAVKENLNVSPEAERQFQREASLLATTRHPNLPRVIDHFILERRQYLVMDFIEGEDLQTRSKAEQISIAEVLQWAEAVCAALSHLHSRTPPIIHRDIKPANIKLQPDGTVVLVDFGLAKLYDDRRTSTGARGFTPGYAPPEQYGSARTDARSDQYALAATVYTLMTGQPPEEGIERMLGKAELTPPRQLRPEIPAHIDSALVRALSVEPADRFPDVRQLSQALKGGSSAATVGAGPSPPEESGESASMSRRTVAIVAGLVGLLGLLLVAGIAGVGLSRFLGLAGTGETTEPAVAASTSEALPTGTAERRPAAVEVAQGGTITFSSDQTVYLLEAREEAAAQDLNSLVEDPAVGALAGPLNISPDGSWLLAEAESLGSRCPTGSSCLILLASDLSSAEAILPEREALSWQGKAAVGSSGDLIVYSGGGGPNERDLWTVMRKNGGWGQPIMLTGESPFAWNHEPAMSSDGRFVVFDCGPEPYGGEGTAICEAATDGSSFEILVRPTDDPGGGSEPYALHHPDYGPDGEVIFESDWAGADIWRWNPGEENVEAVSRLYEGDNTPCVLSDGRIVTLWRGDSEMLQLKVMSPDGEGHFAIDPRVDSSLIGIGCAG